MYQHGDNICVLVPHNSVILAFVYSIGLIERHRTSLSSVDFSDHDGVGWLQNEQSRSSFGTVSYGRMGCTMIPSTNRGNLSVAFLLVRSRLFICARIKPFA